MIRAPADPVQRPVTLVRAVPARAAAILLTGLRVALGAPAAGDTPVGQAPAPGQVGAVAIEVEHIDGRIEQAMLVGVDDRGRWLVRGDAGPTTPVPWQDLATIRFHDVAKDDGPPIERDAFYTADGGAIWGEFIEDADDALVVRTSFSERLVIPFAALAGVQFAGPVPPESTAKAFAEELAARAAGKDVLIARATGDDVRLARGTLLAIDPEQGRFLLGDHERTFQTASIYGVVFARGSAHTDHPAGRLVLRDGQSLPGAAGAGDARVVHWRTPFGAGFDVPAERIGAIRFASPRVVYVSDLEPARIDSAGLLHAPSPPRMDRSAVNGPISIDGHRFDKGIGVHARCELAYRPAGAYQRFAATIGIDDAVRPGGSVVFKVRGDDRELLDSGPITGRDAPRPVVVDVSGVNELILLVDYGADADLADHADWADARLIKPPGPQP